MDRTISHLPTSWLGTTDMLITRVRFGAWAIGGAGWTFAWGGQDDDESVAAIQRAVEAGINWIDNAAARHDTTAAVAVAWTLAWPGVTGAIVGARPLRGTPTVAGTGARSRLSGEAA